MNNRGSKKCETCEGCGQLANTKEREPWSRWLELPVRSAVAIFIGMVSPVICSDCKGTGIKNKTIRYRIFKWKSSWHIGDGIRHKNDYTSLKQAEIEFAKIITDGWQGSIESIEVDERGITCIKSVGSYLDDKYDGPLCWKNRQ